MNQKKKNWKIFKDLGSCKGFCDCPGGSENNNYLLNSWTDTCNVCHEAPYLYRLIYMIFLHGFCWCAHKQEIRTICWIYLQFLSDVCPEDLNLIFYIMIILLRFCCCADKQKIGSICWISHENTTICGIAHYNALQRTVAVLQQRLHKIKIHSHSHNLANS